MSMTSVANANNNSVNLTDPQVKEGSPLTTPTPMDSVPADIVSVETGVSFVNDSFFDELPRLNSADLDGLPRLNSADLDGLPPLDSPVIVSSRPERSNKRNLDDRDPDDEYYWYVDGALTAFYTGGRFRFPNGRLRTVTLEDIPSSWFDPDEEPDYYGDGSREGNVCSSIEELQRSKKRRIWK